MSASEPAGAGRGHAWAAFAAGAALSQVAFLAFLGADTSGEPLLEGVGFAASGLWAGLCLGLYLHGRGWRLRFAAVPAAAGLALVWAILAPRLSTYDASGLALAATALIVWGLAAPVALRPAWLMAGGIVACLVNAFGLAEDLGVVAATAILVVPAAVATLRMRLPGAVAAEPDGPIDGTLATALTLFWAALGALIASLLGTYLAVVRSASYAWSDLGTALLVGALLSAALRGRAGVGRSGLAVGLAVVAALLLVTGFSSFLAPELVVSGPAALQMPARLLTAVRTFPLFLFAGAAGAVGFVAWPRVGRAGWSVLIGAPVGAMLASGRGGVPGGLAYVVPPALASVGLVVLGFAPRKGSPRPVRLITAGAAVLACAGALWTLTAGPFCEWAVARRIFGEFAADRTDSDLAVLPAEAERSSLTPRGTWVKLTSGGLTGEYWNGALVRLRGPGLNDVDPEDYAEVLAAAFAPGGGRPLAVGAGMAGLEDRSYTALDEPGAPSRAPAVVCSRFAFAGLVNPHTVMSCEGLSRLRGRLRDDGVLALWLPVAQMPLADLRRSLATVREVFGRYCLFIYGRNGIVIAGASGGLDFGRLREAWQQAPPTMDTDPADLLVGYVGDEKDLDGLVGGARPYRLSHAPRPAPIVADLAAPDRLLTAACLIQYRLLGSERISARVRAPRPEALSVALRGFDRAYTDVTGALFRQLGRAATRDPAGLKAFMEGPYVRPDLFAPGATGEASRTAAVLSALGLQKAASQVLEKAVGRGEKSVELELQLAAAYEGLGQPADALAAYRRALAIDPNSDLARGRMTALLVSLNRRSEARELLEQIVESQPDNVPAILMLARLYAESPAGHARCAELASRALDLDPGNASAQNLLVLCGSTGR